MPAREAVAGVFLQRRATSCAFDVALNVIAYVPLGALACLFFRAGRTTRGIAIVQAVASSARPSASCMEIAAALHPRPRLLDRRRRWPTPTGAAAGRARVRRAVRTRSSRSPLGEQRERLVIAGAWGDAGLVLLVLWLIAQLNPALPFFGAGNIMAQRLDTVELAILQCGRRWRYRICGLRAFRVGRSSCGPGGALRVHARAALRRAVAEVRHGLDDAAAALLRGVGLGRARRGPRGRARRLRAVAQAAARRAHLSRAAC